MRERLESEIALEDEHGIQYWPIFLLAGGRHVGCCGLRPFEAGVHELGFHIRSDHWRQGYAEEAARAIIGHGFKVLRLRGLFAGHHPDNEGSMQLLHKLGFRFTHHQHYLPTGRDHLCYRLPNSDHETT